MIKLIKNELMKIFKRKTIYFLLILSMIAVIVYNYINPDQNIPISEGTNDHPLISDTQIEKQKDDSERYINSMAYNEFARLYNNNFTKDSWQRLALNKERNGYSYEKIYDQDIMLYLKNIVDYEYNSNTQITNELYGNAINKYNEYVEALKSNDWKKFVNLKIKNLQELKSTQDFSEESIKEIDFEIEWYNLRLNNNIKFNSDIMNQYLDEYRETYYLIIYKESYVDKNSQSDIYELNECRTRLELCKYAIKNKINYDISNEMGVILNNKIDARISFIRTFKHFNVIIIIITIYISSTIITEEISKRTIKNVLIKPHKRLDIIIAKMLACIVTIIISILFIGIVQFFVGGIIFGFDSYSNQYIGYNINSQKIFSISLLTYFIINGILKVPEYLIISLFCILIGISNKNITMSMIITLIICLFCNTILVEWSKVDSLASITRFFITNNWDFSIYLFGNISNINGINLWYSVIIYIIYFVLLLKMSIGKFKKLEIRRRGRNIMIKIVFNKDKNRTIAYDNKKQIGECDFEETNDVWNITHTEVDSNYQGKGIARRLVENVIENSKKYNKNIKATCSYAKNVIENK